MTSYVDILPEQTVAMVIVDMVALSVVLVVIISVGQIISKLIVVVMR